MVQRPSQANYNELFPMAAPFRKILPICALPTAAAASLLERRSSNFQSNNVGNDYGCLGEFPEPIPNSACAIWDATVPDDTAMNSAVVVSIYRNELML